MKSFRRIIVLLGLAVIGGSVALSAMDVIKPTAKVEKVIPDDRFAR